MTHICVSNLAIIGSDNGLSPGRRQAIIWTNAGILLIGPLGTNFREILIEIQTFSLKKTRFQMPSAKCCSFRFGLNVLRKCVWKWRLRKCRSFRPGEMNQFCALMVPCAGNPLATNWFSAQRWRHHTFFPPANDISQNGLCANLSDMAIR